MSEKNIYQMQGYKSREDYLNTLREEYGAKNVDALISVLPESEYFDALITMLQDAQDAEMDSEGGECNE